MKSGKRCKVRQILRETARIVEDWQSSEIPYEREEVRRKFQDLSSELDELADPKIHQRKIEENSYVRS